MRTDLSWVEDLHTRLAIRYADKWTRMWEQFKPEEMAVVRQDWANMLSSCTTAGLLYALDNLPPDWPPNAGEFLEIVKRKPVANTAQQQLTGPQLSAEQIRENLDRLNAARKVFMERKPNAEWVETLLERERNGERLTFTQREMLRDALPRYQQQVQNAIDAGDAT